MNAGQRRAAAGDHSAAAAPRCRGGRCDQAGCGRTPQQFGAAFGTQLQRQLQPAPLHAGVAPGVFQGLLSGARVGSGPGGQQARRECANEEVEVMAQRGVGQQVGQGAQSLAPAGQHELHREQRLQLLCGVAGAQLRRWQHAQRQPGGFGVGQRGGQAQQRGEAQGFFAAQPGQRGPHVSLDQTGLCQDACNTVAHRFQRAGGTLAQHQQIACHAAGWAGQHHGHRRVCRAAEALPRDRAVRWFDLRQPERRDARRVEVQAGEPSLGAQAQPDPQRPRRQQRAAAEHGLACQPALADRRARQQQTGRWHQAVVGMIPAQLEAGAVGHAGRAVTLRQVEFQGEQGLIHGVSFAALRRAHRPTPERSVDPQWLRT